MFRTMLVEDNPSIRQLVRFDLESEFPGMDIVEAPDGGEALRQIDCQVPHLIFMDISLPGENGLSLTRRIKACHPDIVVIVLTSHDSPEYREAAIRNKADYFLSKSAIAVGEITGLVGTIMEKCGWCQCQAEPVLGSTGPEATGREEKTNQPHTLSD